jgi:hypothetical protein
MGLNKKTMRKLISEETLLGMEEREIKREFAMLSERIVRHSRLMKEAEDQFSKRWFEVKEKYLLDDVQFLNMIRLPQDYD